MVAPSRWPAVGVVNELTETDRGQSLNMNPPRKKQMIATKQLEECFVAQDAEKVAVLSVVTSAWFLANRWGPPKYSMRAIFKACLPEKTSLLDRPKKRNILPIM